MGIDGKMRETTTNLLFLYKLIRHLKKGFSPIIGICGSQRIGKSFVGVWLSYKLMELMGKQYTPIDHTFYEPVKAIENLEGRRQDPLMIDEAGDILNRREWYAQTHIALSNIINTQAYKGMIYIFISPFISDIDKTFTKHFYFLLRVDDFGRFKAFQYKKKYDAREEKKAVKRIFLDDVYVTMNDLPSGLWERYLAYSIQQKEMLRKKCLKRYYQKEEDFSPLTLLKKSL